MGEVNNNTENVRITSNIGKLSKLLGKNLYEDPYTFVTEVVCNAYDAHKRVNQSKFIELKLLLDQLSIKDYGVGMTREEFSNKIGVVGDSDKEEEENSIGMYGIGSISFTKYYHTCEYICIKNGKKFTATLNEVEGMGLTITYSDEIDTDEETSTEFRIKVLNYNTLKQQCEERLRFFDNVFVSFNNEIDYNKTIIYEYETFQYVESASIITPLGILNASDELMICLENIPYKIKWDYLGIRPIEMKLALKFKNGEGLIPTLTRENLELNTDYKTVVLRKIESFYKELRSLYNKQVEQSTYSVADVVDVYKKGDHLILKDKKISVGGKHSEVFKGCIVPTIEDTRPALISNYATKMNHFFSLKYYINGSISNGEDYSYLLRDHSKAFRIDKFIAPDRRLKKHEKEFLRQAKTEMLFLEDKKISIKQIKETLLSGYSAVKLEYKKSGRNIWREEAKALKIVYQDFIKDIKKIEDLNIPEPPKKKRPPRPKLELGEGEIKLSYTEPMKVYKTHQNCIFLEKAIPVKDLTKNPFITVYGLAESKDVFNKFFEAYYSNYLTPKVDRKNKVDFAIVNKTTKKFLDNINLHNYINLETFMAGKTIGFKRLVTSSLIAQLLQNPIFKYIDDLEGIIHKSYIDEFKELKQYKEDNIYTAIHLPEIYSVAEEYNLYDTSIYPLYTKVKNSINDFKFITDLFSMYFHMSQREQENINIKGYIQELCKNRKIKIHYENIFEQINL